MADSQSRRYSSGEVSDIIRLALENKSGRDDVSYGDLLDIARQSGVSQDQVQAAIEYQETEGQLDKAREQWKKRQKQEFLGHLRVYAIVNGALFLINLFTPGPMWVQWPLIGWGIGLAIHGSNAFFPSEESITKGARKILRKQRRRNEKELFDRILEEDSRI